MEMKLSDEQMHALVAEALFERIDPEQRKQLITGAIARLLEPEKDSYIHTGRKGPGQLQQAVDTALASMARDVIRQSFEQGETREKVEGLVREAIERVLTVGRDKTLDAMSEALQRALWSFQER